MPLSEWNGVEIARRVVAAQLAAVDEATAAAAEEGKKDHWWTDRSGNLERETISEPAQIVPGGVAGKFGTTRKQGFYGLFLEIEHPFLRPIGDRVFPTLQERLRGNYEGLK